MSGLSGQDGNSEEVSGNSEESQFPDYTRSTNESSGTGNFNSERESRSGKTIRSIPDDTLHGLQREDRKPVRECIFCDLRKAKKVEIVAMVR
jgi:hypothetical protein